MTGATVLPPTFWRKRPRRSAQRHGPATGTPALTNRRTGKQRRCGKRHRGALPRAPALPPAGGRRAARFRWVVQGVAAPPSPTRPEGNHPAAGAARRKACLAPPTTARSGYARATDGRTAEPYEAGTPRVLGGKACLAPHEVNDAGLATLVGGCPYVVVKRRLAGWMPGRGSCCGAWRPSSLVRRPVRPTSPVRIFRLRKDLDGFGMP
jgi:hypothetical protein